MSKRRLIVHVGLPKAGSSTIQHVLGSLEKSLRQEGVHVPTAGRVTRADGSIRHSNLLRTLVNTELNTGQGPWSDLVDELRRSNARTFVLSDEMLSHHPRAAIVALTLLSESCELDVSIVGYVRPQYQYFEALYAQNPNSALRRLPFDLSVAASLAGRPASRHPWLNYGLVFAPWRDAFGPQVIVTPLEADRRDRPSEDLVAHFLGILEVGDPRSGSWPRVNTRRGAREVEVRRLTALALTGASLVRQRWRERLVRLDGLATLIGDDDPFAGFTRDQARTVMGKFEAENATFASDYGIDPSGVLFRNPSVDTLKRPNVASWHDLDDFEQRSVRDYVVERTGVDLTRFGRRRPVRPWPEIGSRPRLALSLFDRRLASCLWTEFAGHLSRTLHGVNDRLRGNEARPMAVARRSSKEKSSAP